MIIYEVATKVRDTEAFPQHNIFGLISGITSIVLFSQEKPLQWKEINTHTYTYTHFQFATLPKVALLHGCFLRFLNCTNGTISRNTSHMKHVVTGEIWDLLNVRMEDQQKFYFMLMNNWWSFGQWIFSRSKFFVFF